MMLVSCALARMGGLDVSHELQSELGLRRAKHNIQAHERAREGEREKERERASEREREPRSSFRAWAQAG
jgi:hypothetical protein